MYQTIEQLAKKYGIKTCYIKNAIQKGELDYYRFGEKTKSIKVSDFEKWIASKKNKPAEIKEEVPLMRFKYYEEALCQK